MKPSVKRSYDVKVFPYYDDESCCFSIDSREINERTVRIFLSCYNFHEEALYLGVCDRDLWFVDSENRRGLVMTLPNDFDDIYSCFEEIDDYDEEQCAVLAETVFLLYQDILIHKIRLPELPICSV